MVDNNLEYLIRYHGQKNTR